MSAPLRVDDSDTGSVSCAWCGRTADSPGLTWVTSVEGAGAAAHTRFYCPDCARDHLRAIEGRLDAVWW